MRAGKYTFHAALVLITLFFGSIFLALLVQTTGDVIVYSFGDGISSQLRAIDLRTRNDVPLVKTGNPLAPAWSPDGCQIAFHTRAGATSGELRLLSITAGHPVTLLDQSVGSFGPSEPDWSPNGSQLVFVGRDLSLYILHLSDAKTTKLTTGKQNVSSPDWSSTSGKIVFQGLSALFDTNSEQKQGAEVYTISVRGGNAKDVSNNHAQDTDPVWSPDGTQIAFVSNRNGDAGDIFVMSADGSSVHKIAHMGQVSDLSWSPDGRRLAVALSISGGWNVYLINMDGTDLEQITFDQRPAFSREPDWQPQPCSRN